MMMPPVSCASSVHALRTAKRVGEEVLSGEATNRIRGHGDFTVNRLSPSNIQL